MGRGHTETSTLGWLLPPEASEPSRRSGQPRQGSDNWPIPLVVRREAGGSGWKELSADWFDAADRPSLSSSVVESDSAEPYQLVSRRRLRWAHALFALLFLALLTLAAWEAHIYLGFGNPADYFR